MATFTTLGGETVDEIAWRYYGHQDGTAEAVLDVNPGLAAYGPVLPTGVDITLPVLTSPQAVAIPVKLYD